MTRRSSLAMVLGLFVVAPAAAQDRLSYSYWDASYLNSQVGEKDSAAGDDDVEGFRLGLGVGLSKHINFVGEFDQRNYSGARDNFSSVGLGWHTGGPGYQVQAAASYERYDVDINSIPNEDDSDEGWGAELGVRVPLSDFELQAAYKYIDWGKEGETIEVTGARYGASVGMQLSPWWSLIASYRVTERIFDQTGVEETLEYTEWTAGFRRYFATDADRRVRKGGVLFGVDAEAEAPPAE